MTISRTSSCRAEETPGAWETRGEVAPMTKRTSTFSATASGSRRGPSSQEAWGSRKRFIQAQAPGATETTGLSPSAVSGGQEYFAGRLLIFTRAFGATSLDDDEAVSTIVHEFTHAFGCPHKCGYYGWPQPPSFSCSMNYFLTWIYDIGTRNLHRFEFGTEGPHLCSKHVAGVREVHLEENPAMWRW